MSCLLDLLQQSWFAYCICQCAPIHACVCVFAFIILWANLIPGYTARHRRPIQPYTICNAFRHAVSRHVKENIFFDLNGNMKYVWCLLQNGCQGQHWHQRPHVGTEGESVAIPLCQNERRQGRSAQADAAGAAACAHFWHGAARGLVRRYVTMVANVLKYHTRSIKMHPCIMRAFDFLFNMFCIST